MMSHSIPTLDAPQWGEIEIELTAGKTYVNPYLEVDVWVDFTHDTGSWIRRPAFWDGESSWKVRFASPLDKGRWRWRSGSTHPDEGLVGQRGHLQAVSARNPDHRFEKRGFWKMGPSRRNLMHHDGSSDLLVADTAWALPWRATPEQVRRYAGKRQSQGFNATLLMTIQPDMFAEGPMDRSRDHGFDVGFMDLKEGHLTQPRPEYFQTMDILMAILVEHEIVPVYQPVFHGYGWKGKTAAGAVIPPDEYARYCRYLVARYGARPAIWLVGADGRGDAPGIPAGGEAIEKWDAYRQPAGLHYCPHARSDAYQDASWLDFQWCQTGHNGEHIPERVTHMWRNAPAKGVANGEPTYENIGETGKAVGWWQGHEAWCNWIAGGTMGVVYGAGSLWQWRLHGDEPGHDKWCYAEGAGWAEALEFEGANYVGVLGKLLRDLPLEGIAPHWEAAITRGLLAVPGQLAVVYRPKGNGFGCLDTKIVPRTFRVFDAKTGRQVHEGEISDRNSVEYDHGGEPAVFVFLKDSMNRLSP